MAIVKKLFVFTLEDDDNGPSTEMIFELDILPAWRKLVQEQMDQRETVLSYHELEIELWHELDSMNVVDCNQQRIVKTEVLTEYWARLKKYMQ